MMLLETAVESRSLSLTTCTHIVALMVLQETLAVVLVAVLFVMEVSEDGGYRSGNHSVSISAGGGVLVAMGLVWLIMNLVMVMVMLAKVRRLGLSHGVLTRD